MDAKHKRGAGEEHINSDVEAFTSEGAKRRKHSPAPNTLKQPRIELFNQLPEALIKSIASEWLSRREVITAEQAARTHHGKQRQKELRSVFTLFKPFLTETDAAYAVVTGLPQRLLRILTEEAQAAGDTPQTSLFFKKCHEIKDPSGQVFYDVSPADLIDIVWDLDMKQQVVPFVATLDEKQQQHFLNDWQKQHKSRGRGGADLIKVDKDPITMSFDAFLNTRVGGSRMVVSGEEFLSINFEPMAETFPLLENPNGLIYYQDNEKHVHWYYADKDTRTIQAIRVDECKMQEEYNLFKAAMKNMPPMSARRSSDEEHQLIRLIMRDAGQKPVNLIREGYKYVRYEMPLTRVLAELNKDEFLLLKSKLASAPWPIEIPCTQDDYHEQFFDYATLCTLQDSWPIELNDLRDKLVLPVAIPVDYCDTSYDFNRYYNVYRNYLNDAIDSKGANNIWSKELGNIQKEVIWLLQREYVGYGSPYSPSCSSESSTRSFNVSKRESDEWFSVDLYDRGTGLFNKLLGTDSAVSEQYASLVNEADHSLSAMCSSDFFNFFSRVQKAKKGIAEFRLDEGLLLLSPTRQL